MKKENKMKQLKTVRGHVGYLCRLEGGKSQAKIHDAIQIMNLHYDLVLEVSIKYYVFHEKEIPIIAKNPRLYFDDYIAVFMQAAAKRWLKKNKVKKK